MTTPSHVSDPFDLQASLQVAVTTFAVLGAMSLAANRWLSKPRANNEFGNRVVSLVHAVVSTVICAYALSVHQGGWLDSPATRIEGMCLAFSTAYFLIDTISMALTDWSWLYFWHHVITISTMGTGAFFGHYGFIMCAATVLGEVGNPIMDFRWLLGAAGMRGHAAAKWLSRAWFCVFFVTRMLVSPWLLFHALAIMHWLFVVMGCIMVLASWKVWFDWLCAEVNGEWWEG
jgi:hypothetical protein